MRICDLHCDTLLREGDLIKNSHMIDLDRLSTAGYAVQAFAAFVDLREHPDPWKQVNVLLDKLDRGIADSSGRMIAIKSSVDVEECIRRGIVGALATVEEGGVLQGNMSRLDDLYKRGVRMMTITWNYENELGSPGYNADSGANPAFDRYVGGGLKELGFKALERMEALGIIADVSHLSDSGFWDVVKSSRRPFVASHSNARAIRGVSRNLTDDMLRAIGDAGGLVGINFCVDFSGDGLEALAAHARCMVDKAGIEAVALGSDFDGISPNPAITDCSRVPQLAEELRKTGFTESQVELIMGENAIRFLKENL